MKRNVSRTVTVGAVISIAVASLLSTPTSAIALSGSDFNPGYIISDGIFFDAPSMSQADIQSFIQSKETRCTASNGMPCLKDYSQATSSRAASPDHCSSYAGGPSESASQILYNVAQACGINPQVLLVTLEKEQGLVSAVAPSQARYDRATGYGCPDTPAGCNSKYYGFYNQVYLAAWQLKEYTVDPSYWNFKPGTFPIRYSEKDGCTGPAVNIQNLATAALYNYTPYQPNAAALANLYGQTDDPCSSYGNRNFWTTFSAWFGSPTGDRNPFGGFDLTVAPERITFGGWAVDPDAISSALRVDVYVDDVGFASFTANSSRPDVGTAYPGSGNNHGISGTYPISVGTHKVCLYAINIGPGSNSLFGCRSVVIVSGSPVGESNVSASAGQVLVSGWAIDPDSSAPVRIDVYADDKGLASFPANTNRPGVGAAYPGYGDSHGFSQSFAMSPGQHVLCVFAINVNAGSNTLLGCSNYNIASGSPLGGADVTAIPGNVRIGGWSIDPDVAAPVRIDVYADGNGIASFPANSSRPDVGQAYPGYGDNHGISQMVPLSPGAHSLCIYAINSGPGSNTLLGCYQSTVPGGSPFGGSDVTVVAGGLHLGGWVIDPDIAGPVRTDVYVDGVGFSSFQADSSRPDVGNTFSGYGNNHGIDKTFTIPSGNHRMCVFGINVGVGSNTPLGCYNFTVF